MCDIICLYFTILSTYHTIHVYTIDITLLSCLRFAFLSTYSINKKINIMSSTNNTPANWQANIAYNDLPHLPPLQDVENKAILKLCIEARTALASLRQAGELIPNQAMLINIIPMLEAKGRPCNQRGITLSDSHVSRHTGNKNTSINC